VVVQIQQPLAPVYFYSGCADTATSSLCVLVQWLGGYSNLWPLFTSTVVGWIQQPLASVYFYSGWVDTATSSLCVLIQLLGGYSNL
jgi:hypothetical protein